MVDLPAPFGTDESGDLPRLDGECHPVQRDGRPEVLAQAADFDRCFHARHGRETRAAAVVTPASRLRRRWHEGHRLRRIPRARDARMLVRGTRYSLASEDNGYMDRAADWRGGPAETLRRIAMAPHAPAVAGGAARGARRRPRRSRSPRPTAASNGEELQIAFVLLALFTTLPLGLLWAYPAAAAVAVSAACVLSLSAFHALTVAGLIAAAGRPVPAGSQRLTAAGRGPRAAVPGTGASWSRGPRGQDPHRAAGRAGPGGRVGRGRPAGPQRGRRAQRRAGGHRGHPGRAHGARGARPGLPRAARRRGPPHFHDRRAGGDRPADHAGDARGRGAAAVGDRRHRPGGADRDAAAARRAARGHPGPSRGATGSPSRACCSSTSCSTRHGTPRGRASASSSADA